MKKATVTISTVLLAHLISHAMEQTIVTQKLDQLPEHELNIIASFTKRAGKDTLRCVNTILNTKIISQNNLYQLYNTAKINNNYNELVRLRCYNKYIPTLHNELLDSIQDNNTKLAQWCLNYVCAMTIPFHDKCIETATIKNNLELVKLLFNPYPDNMKCYEANAIIITAAKYGHLNIIKSFIDEYKHSINFRNAIILAKYNEHQEVVKFLKQRKKSIHNHILKIPKISLKK